MTPSTTTALRWHGPGDLRLDRVPVRAAGPGEVRVLPAYVGVCGSDLHEIVDGPHAIPVTHPHSLSGGRAPLVLGHEFSAVVESSGPGVEGLAPGDRVAVEPNYRCGTCAACQGGRYHVCEHFGFAGLMGDGGMAGLAVLPAYMLHRLPGNVDLAQAAVLEPAAVALHAVRRSGIGGGDTAVVIGLGPVGLLVCQLLKLRGVRSIVGVEPSARRRALALRLGVGHVIDPASTKRGPADHARKLLGGGATVSFEVVGHQTTFDTAVASVRSGGTVLLLGLAGELCFDGFAAVNAEITIRASVGYNDCYPELIDLVARGRLDLAPFAGDIEPLADAVGVLNDLARGRRQGLKTLIRCAGADTGAPVPSVLTNVSQVRTWR